MRGLSWIVIAGVVGGCSFSNKLGDEPPIQSDDAGPGDDATVSDEAVGLAPCNTADPTGLVLCLEFEDGVGDGMLLDSSPAERKVETTGLSDFARAEGSMAAHIGGDSITYVPQEAALELKAAYTLSAWVYADTMPAWGQLRGIVDHELQYAMFLKGNGQATIAHYCINTDLDEEWTAGVPVDAWSFLACTWDGTSLCAYRWTSATDHEKYCKVATPPRAAGAKGLSIGHLSDAGLPHDRFDGKLDSVQVYSRSLADKELCAMIGQGPDCLL